LFRILTYLWKKEVFDEKLVRMSILVFFLASSLAQPRTAGFRRLL